MDHRFRYNLNNSDANGESESESEFSRTTLEIYVHHARNIHNICIYDNQDVYAKFSLTCDPDEALSTRIINGGGKNPDFNETLRMTIAHLDAVLKCEIWMLSRARNYMEDQLLGFALVPLSTLAELKATKTITREYSLSSTDLFHSPAGTVQLSLSLSASPLSESPAAASSITSEVVLLDRKASEAMLDRVEYDRIEFPDISVARENQKMVSEYFGSGSFLHLGAPASPQNSGFFSSTTTTTTTTSLSEDMSSGDSIGAGGKKSPCGGGGESSVTGTGSNQGCSSMIGCETPTSSSNKSGRSEACGGGEIKAASFSTSEEDESSKSGEAGRVFPGPIGSVVEMEAEQSAMQQQIVDIYMRSMQQFTESLAKMKLPMELDKAESRQDRSGDAIQSRGGGSNKIELEKKDGSRVFYGSRAFF